MKDNNEKLITVFLIVVALTGLALGLSDGVFSNYFKDAYQSDAFQRGIIELPRELPGVLSMFIISGLAFLGDIRLSVIAQVLSIAGLLALSFFTPPFNVMLVFMFINSLGMHMYMPLADSIGLSLSKKGGFGAMMGRFNGVRTALSMMAGIIVFVGFKTGFFSFTTQIKTIFIIASVILTVVLCLLLYMRKLDSIKSKPGKVRIILRKEYGLYYLLTVLFGARKQIMYVYCPWVLIELLNFKADNMAILAIIGSAIGIFFIPAVGRWVDRFGVARIMMIEAAFFFIIYIAYAFLSAGLYSGWLKAAGATISIAVIINIADRMTMQFGMVRSVFMRSIALSPEDVTQTLSIGMALDHILSIVSAVICGYFWRELGPQYVFIFAALLSAANLTAAFAIKRKTEPAV